MNNKNNIVSILLVLFFCILKLNAMADINDIEGQINATYFDHISDKLIICSTVYFENSNPSSKIYSWNGSNLVLISSGVQGVINSVLVRNQKIIICGRIYEIDGVKVRNIAELDGTTWNSMNGGLGNLNSNIKTMCIYGNLLMVGGSELDENSSNNLFSWNDTLWSRASFSLEGSINKIKQEDSSLYVIGDFQKIDSIGCNGIAKYINGVWSSLIPDIRGEINSFTRLNNNLFIGGLFRSIDCTNSFLAKWDGLELTTLDSSIHFPPNSMIARGQEIYFAGISECSNSNISPFCKWNGSVFSPLALPPNIVSFEYISTIIEYNSSLILIGKFKDQSENVFQIVVYPLD